MNHQSSMPSPVSPYDNQNRRSISSAQQQQPCYPASPQHEQAQAQQQQPQPPPQQQQSQPQPPGPRGLGLYPGSMPPPQQSTVSPVMASPQSEWQHQQGPPSAEQHHHPAEYPSSQPPDIFSAAFDPFSGFSASSNTGGMVGAHSPEAPGLEFCQTPPSSNVQSHRGSVSSYAPSDSGSNGGAYTPRAKHEDVAGEWYTAGSNDLQRAISQAPMPYPTSATAMGSQTEQLYRESQPDALYRPQHHEWSKTDTHGYLTDLGTDGRARFDSMQPVLPSAGRVRKRRQRTTPEEATHECRVCGKLFKRSYNWKSHMETHNPDRKYPHPCTHVVGSSQCAKKFQRKTDLDRHVDSVHLKSRNHKCPLCGNRFARRDTLRRHTEDGCPKRFELNIREQQAGSAPLPASATPQQHPPPPPPPQQQRWSFSAPATGFHHQRERSFSQASPMGPPPPVPGFTAFAPQPTPTAVYQN